MPRRWQRLTRPRLWMWASAGLLGLLAVVITLGLVVEERATTRQLAKAALTAAADTYESQLIRSLRETDQALRVLAFAAATNDDALPRLRSHGLVPPEQLFQMRLQPAAPGTGQGTGAGLALETLGAGPGARLRFSRPVPGLDTMRAALEVEADFFVAAYDTERLGKAGAIAMLARDGKVLAAHGKLEPPGSPWRVDRELDEPPVVMAMSLSIDERLAPLRTRHRTMAVLCATVLLVVALVTRMMTRLHQRLEQLDVDRAKRVHDMAYRDALTGLANRPRLERAIDELAQRVRDGGGGLAVLFLDLDGFKTVNDTHGHGIGDGLLCEVARRLERCVRPGDLVARLGGDEFVVLLPRMPELSGALPVAHRILAEIGRGMEIEDHACHVTTSIGIACLVGDAANLRDALRLADDAMYLAKRSGKNRIAIAQGIGCGLMVQDAA